MSLGVSTDAIQEHYYTGAKIVGSFYNNGEYYSFLFMKIKNLNQANEFKCQKVQNTYERGQERDSESDNS